MWGSCPLQATSFSSFKQGALTRKPLSKSERAALCYRRASKLSQLSGNVSVIIKGVGFKNANIKIIFTCGKTPVGALSKLSIEAPATFISETEVFCITPSN